MPRFWPLVYHLLPTDSQTVGACLSRGCSLRGKRICWKNCGRVTYVLGRNFPKMLIRNLFSTSLDRNCRSKSLVLNNLSLLAPNRHSKSHDQNLHSLSLGQNYMMKKPFLKFFIHNHSIKITMYFKLHLFEISF